MCITIFAEWATARAVAKGDLDAYRAVLQTRNVSAQTRAAFASLRHSRPVVCEDLRRGLVERATQELARRHGDTYEMRDALRASGLMHSSVGADLYSRCLTGPRLRQVLEELDLMKSAPHHVIMSLKFRDSKLVDELVTAEMSADWCALQFRYSQDLLWRAMEKCGLFKADLGLAWYETHMSGYVLIRALRRVGLLTPALGADWFAVHREGVELVDILREFGLLTSALGAQWLADNLADHYTLLDALRECGLLTHRLGLDFFRDSLHRNDLDEDLRKCGMLTPSTAPPAQWLAENARNNDDMLDCLRESGQLKASLGADWYATYLSGSFLLRALRECGLLTATLGVDWCATYFQGRCLVGALLESGLLTPELGEDWLQTHLGGEHLQLALEMRSAH